MSMRMTFYPSMQDVERYVFNVPSMHRTQWHSNERKEIYMIPNTPTPNERDIFIWSIIYFLVAHEKHVLIPKYGSKCKLMLLSDSMMMCSELF